MRTIDIVRRMAIKYTPNSYIIFGKFFVRKRALGGYEAGRAILTKDDGSNDNNTVLISFGKGGFGSFSSNFYGDDYDYRTYSICRIKPQTDEVYLAATGRNDDNLSGVDSANGQAFVYNRIFESKDISEFIASEQVSMLRFHYNIGTTFNSRNFNQDQFVFDFPMPVENLTSRRVASRDTARKIVTDTVNFERISRVDTGFVDRNVRRRLAGAPARILMKVIADTGTSRTWLISQYSGALSNGDYKVNIDGSLSPVSPYSARLRSLVNQTQQTSGIAEINGYRSVLAFCVESAIQWVDLPIDTGIEFFFDGNTNYSGHGSDLVELSLFDGDVKLRTSLNTAIFEYSVNNGPWYNAKTLTLFNSPGDRWCRDEAGYPGTVDHDNIFVLNS